VTENSLDHLATTRSTQGTIADGYLSGDSDLDGLVDSSDLNNLALNWQQDVAVWSGGDFTADGAVNASDLNELALNWRESIAVAAPVPDPSPWLLATLGLGMMWRMRHGIGECSAIAVTVE